MKIGLKLAETGYRFGTEERARIYLTNALEPWVKQLPLIGFDALAHEAAAVNEIKRHKRFTVVIGNPPYSNFGMLNKNPFILGLLEDYKRGLNEKKLNLDDDFIKFVRFSQRLLDATGAGVLGMITNNSFVDGITHRQMRQSLMGTFNLLHVLNLHGSSKKKETAPDGSEDENVFDIQQGVATTLASTKGQATGVLVNDLWGKRETKYAALGGTSVRSGKWIRPKLAAPYFFFAEKNLDDGAEYNDCLGLKAIFIVSGNGVKTERDGISIHFTKEEIETSVHDFQSLDEATLRRKYGTRDDSRDWKVKKAKADVVEHKGQPLYRRLLYRPFDIRHTWYSGQTRGFIGTPAFPTMRHMFDGNVAMVTTRQTAERFDLLCTDNLVGHKSVAGYDINTAFPLYVFEEELSFDLGERQAGSSHSIQKRPNLSVQFLERLAAALQLPQKGAHGLPAGLTPEDIFHYAYAVLHT
ncbi:MAG: type ISP restriction/modification enzyme [Opitutaceae bacterium]